MVVLCCRTVLYTCNCFPCSLVESVVVVNTCCPASCRCCDINEGASSTLGYTEKPGSSQNVVDSQHLILIQCYAGRSASTPEAVKVDYSAGCYPGREELFTFTRIYNNTCG